MLDSQDTVDDAELAEASCPCGNEAFNVAAGIAFCAESDDVRWVYAGLRCVRDGVLGRRSPVGPLRTDERQAGPDRAPEEDPGTPGVA